MAVSARWNRTWTFVDLIRDDAAARTLKGILRARHPVSAGGRDDPPRLTFARPPLRGADFFAAGMDSDLAAWGGKARLATFSRIVYVVVDEPGLGDHLRARLSAQRAIWLVAIPPGSAFGGPVVDDRVFTTDDGYDGLCRLALALFSTGNQDPDMRLFEGDPVRRIA